MDFIRKQSIDILEWTESAGGTLARRFPVAGNEVRYGASLTVREIRLAVFVDESRMAHGCTAEQPRSVVGPEVCQYPR